jgi:uncharacterized membrane protein YeaQ/YmgE (transglycosylase-associated protein family)
MDVRNIVITILIGLVAGWLASFVVGGPGGAIKYIVSGLLGAIVGSLLFGALGINLGGTNPIVGTIITATVGAIIVVLLARLIT